MSKLTTLKVLNVSFYLRLKIFGVIQLKFTLLCGIHITHTYHIKRNPRSLYVYSKTTSLFWLRLLVAIVDKCYLVL